MNLSKREFTKTEYKLLGYNLNFIPTPKSINKKNLTQDIKQFNRRVKLRDHFGLTTPEKQAFKSSSSWEPSTNHHTVKTFLEDFSNKVNHELADGPQRNKTKNNLNKQELEALENLKSLDDIIVTKADKGGAVVVQDVSNYIKEANRQLQDRSFYEKLDHNPTGEHAALVCNAIDGLKQRELLDHQTAERLKPVDPKTPKLYLLPKIHKDKNPGRPVVSSVGCHTETISSFCDYHLQPFNKELPSYVQDTTSFVNKIESLTDEDPREDTILVTMDVRSLYTNIPNNEGLDAVKSFFQARSRPGDGALSKVINVFLSLILMLNNFTFNDTNYIQINGCSMGTKCAPTYASLFMGRFENTHILPKIRDKILMYVRYIDDVFLIWKGTEKELQQFLEEINKVHPTIKFDHCYSRESVDFLDTTVKYINRRFTTTLFTKPTDRKAYLHRKSYHPSSTKKSIAFSQACRLRRICTDLTDFWEHANKLKNDLVARGYKEQEVSREIQRAAELDRRTLLTYKEKETSSRIPLIVTYNQNLPNLKGILDATWDHIKINPTTHTKFPEKPIICYKRNRNLRDEIGQTTISKNRVVRKRTSNRGRCSPCLGRSDCLCCKHIIGTNFFTNANGTSKFDIWHRTNCRTKNGIYLAFCIKSSSKQYVGKVEIQGG